MRYIVILLSLVYFSSCSEKKETNSSGDNKQTKDSAMQKENNNDTEYIETSEITCPKCGFTKTEKLPTEVCQIIYTCTKCKTELTPKDGDCCVYCSYGTHMCPSKQ